MKSITLYRWTGIIGIALYVLMLLEIPLYFVYKPTAEGTTPLPVTLQRIIIDLFICLSLIGFFSGFKQVISEKYPNLGALVTFFYSCGIVFATVALLPIQYKWAGPGWRVISR